MIDAILRSNNYTTQTELRRAYRGASADVNVVRVRKGSFSGYAHMAEGEKLLHLERIKNVQDRILHIAKIHEIITTVVVTVEAPGTLLWELESAPEYVDIIRTKLDEARHSLKEVALVHADIRPWNIMFDAASQTMTLFDWGFSFFTDGPSIGNLEAHLGARGFTRAQGHEITKQDIENCIAILRSQKSPEEVWNHSLGEFSWRPSWCKSFEPSTLKHGQRLGPGQAIYSPNRCFRLIYQGDGNLVIEDISRTPHSPIWHTGTYNTPAGCFIMQGDGNAVIYSALDHALWASHTHGLASAWLSLENDGLLVVNSPAGRAWDSKRGRLLA
jgi:hypothetical protein